VHRRPITPILKVRRHRVGAWKREYIVIILGVILLVLGLVIGVPVLYTIGLILLVVGAVLWLLGSTGRAVGGRNHYW
jgi:hypothetical protein